MSPRRAALLNLLALAACLGAALLVARGESTGAAAASAHVDGPASVADAYGHRVPVRAYRRVLSGSQVADQLLVALLERDRILATSGVARGSSLSPHQLEGLPVFARLHELEAVIELAPDLIVLHSFAQDGKVARLREAGLTVFDLGPMSGLEAFAEDARQLSALLGLPERGAYLADTFTQQMRAVAADVPLEARPRAIYLGSHGPLLFGGTTGTSYHDVLVHAGLVDAAAGPFTQWPSYSSEQLLALDPEHIVASSGKAVEICARPGLSQLRPCRGEGKIVEVPADTLVDPGLPMLDSAMIIRRAIHGPPPAAPEPHR